MRQNPVSMRRSASIFRDKELFSRPALWLLLALAGAVFYAFLLRQAEFTTDEGNWILDSWLRWTEHRWLTPPWLPTSQGIRQLPLVSWIFIPSLAIWPSV